MKRYTIEVADEAWKASEAQIRYIAIERQAPGNSSRWVNRLLAQVAKLELLPMRGPIDPHQSKVHGMAVHRLVFAKTYLIFYTVDDTNRRVNVVSFRHGAKRG